jgi:peptide-methionine (S)-S-oxide reductase
MTTPFISSIIISFTILYNISYSQINKQTKMENISYQNKEKLEIATFGAGCFWCTEAVFERLEGVEKVISGYSGGHVKNPSYKEVCNGTTGHAEVTQVYFDPEIISFSELLDVFWHTHDPTTLNRQGNDSGTQYRSVIFYHDNNQKLIAEESKLKMEKSGTYKDPIVTEISPLINFYEAEDYHQDYFNNNPDQPYCSVVISPKIKKFTAKYQEKLK